ncbi:MAG: hypothetical protein WKF75_05995 [Singulisphaera sp.]
MTVAFGWWNCPMVSRPDGPCSGRRRATVWIVATELVADAVDGHDDLLDVRVGSGRELGDQLVQSSARS